MSQPAGTDLLFLLLGQPQWRLGSAGGLLPGKFAALVAYLAAQGRQPSEQLARLLWPGDLQRGLDSLRQHEYRLRKTTGHRIFDHGETVALLDGIACDLNEHPAGWPLQRLLAPAEFLAGWAAEGVSPPFASWLAEQRRRWRGLIADALCERAAALEADARSAEALPLCERAAELAPWSEAAWRLCMRLRWRHNDHAAALAAFARLEEQLRHHGAQPSAETMALRDAVRAGTRATRPAVRSVPPALLRPPQLIGREAAWAAMARAWAGGRAFLLYGAAGIGKSRLLADFLQAQQDPGPGGAALVVEGRPGEEGWPYAVLTALLRAALRRLPQSVVATVAPPLAVLLEPSGAHGAVEQPVLWRAAESLLAAAADAGLQVVAVDDLQFADLASLEALRWLAAGELRQRLRFGWASRLLEAGARQTLVDDWLSDSQRPERIELTPWTATDLSTLLDSLQLDLPVSAAALAEHAGGQPFLTLETLKDIALDTARDPALPLPATVAPLLERRVRSVPAHALPLLGLAAVFGADATLERAAAALACPVGDVVAQQELLEAAGIARGPRLAHELLRQAALAALPAAERRQRHAQVAAVLAAETQVPPARVATHWAAAQRWPEAGAAFHAAGLAARDAGRLAEQEALLAQSAQAWALAGDRGGEFDALAAAIESIMVRQGPVAVQARLPRLHELADDGERRARVAMLEAEVRLNGFRDPAALAAAEAAAALAAPYPALLGDAQAHLAVALAQVGRFDDALAALERAAAALADPRHLRKVLGLRVYVLYEAGRIGQAVAASEAVLQAAEAVGDHAVAGQVQGNLATLVMLSGEPARAVANARAARERHRDMGSGINSVLAGMTLVTLGSALTACGSFTEAGEVLDEAVRTLGPEAPPPARAKALIAAARLWLLLGEPARAVAALPEAEPAWPAPMLIQWHAVRARAAALAGHPAAPHAERVREVQAAHLDAPLMQSPWLDWAGHAEPREAALRMRTAAEQYAAAGMPGTECSALLCVVNALIELGDAAGAAALAARLRPRIVHGLHPTSYVPEAWLTLARAFETAGDAAAGAGCRREGRQWIEQVALPQVPAAWQPGFLRRNPVNAALLHG